MATDLIVKKNKKNILNNKSKRNKNDEYRGYQLVYQHNRLVEAKYDLTLQEKRLVLFAVSRIRIDEFDVKPVIFSCRELIEMCGLHGDSMYSELKKTTAKLMSRVFVVKNLDDNTYTQLNWVSRSTYHEKEGIVEIQFNKDLSRFLLDLKANFTAIPLSQTLGLSSVYAIRMYELLKQYETIRERAFELDILRETLGISKTKLVLYKDFKKKVIMIAQRELSLKTDIKFSFEEIKLSRKVKSLRFFIYKNDPKKNNEKKEDLDKVKIATKELKESDSHKNLLEMGYSRQSIFGFFKKYSEEQIKTALLVVFDQIDKKQVLNPKALFRSALKEGWSLDKFVIRKKQI